MKRVRSEITLILGAAIFFCAFVLGDLFGTSARMATPATPPAVPVNAAASNQVKALQADLGVATRALARLSSDYDVLRAQLKKGFVQDRIVVVTQPDTVHTLVEPKLVLAVGDLIGSSVYAVFGTTSRWFTVGERYDFRLDDCTCFLLLLESRRDWAKFRFGCEKLVSLSSL